MLGEKFEKWPADLFPNTTLVTIGNYVTNLGYLEDRSSYFIEKSKKILVGLDTAAVIPKTND